MLKPYAPLIAGSLGRSIACVVCSPLELAKTRMQVRHLFCGISQLPSKHNSQISMDALYICTDLFLQTNLDDDIYLTTHLF